MGKHVFTVEIDTARSRYGNPWAADEDIPEHADEAIAPAFAEFLGEGWDAPPFMRVVEKDADADRMANALTQIREVADFPVGARLTDKGDQLTWALAKLERIGNIAGDGRPDEDWPGHAAADAGDMSTSDGLGAI